MAGVKGDAVEDELARGLVVTGCYFSAVPGFPPMDSW